VNTTAIAYGHKIDQSLSIWWHARAVVFTNVRKLRVGCSPATGHQILQKKQKKSPSEWRHIFVVQYMILVSLIAPQHPSLYRCFLGAAIEEPYRRNRSNYPSFKHTRKLINSLGPGIIGQSWSPELSRKHTHKKLSTTTRIMERITNIQSYGSGNVGCGNVTNSHNITVKKTDDEDSRIRQWLSPLKPQYRHQSVQTNRVDGVGDWFLKMKGFREWSGNQGAQGKAVLFCYGHPGVGKTHIRCVGKLSQAS